MKEWGNETRSIETISATQNPVFKHLSDFSSESIQMDVRPLEAITYIRPDTSRGELVFPKTPKLSFRHGWFSRLRPKAEAVVDRSNGYIPNLLNGKADWGELTPLPLSRVDVSTEGTRGLKVISPRFPGKILCLTGIGVVRGRNIAPVDTEAGKSEIVVDPPEDDKKLSEMMQMGTVHVDGTGKIWSVANHSPFGTYSPNDAANKAAQTELYGREFGVELVAWGRYEKTGNEWLAYTVPATSVRPDEALVADIKGPVEQVGKIYGTAIESLFEKIRKLHAKRLMHSQIHPGNWYVEFKDGKPIPRITDWSTVQNIDTLEQSSVFENNVAAQRLSEWEQEYEGLTPQQKALAVDLSVALRDSVTLINSPHVSSILLYLGISRYSEEKQLAIDATDFWFTSEMLAYELHVLVRAVTGYLGVKGATEKTRF